MHDSAVFTIDTPGAMPPNEHYKVPVDLRKARNLFINARQLHGQK